VLHADNLTIFDIESGTKDIRERVNGMLVEVESLNSSLRNLRDLLQRSIASLMLERKLRALSSSLNPLLERLSIEVARCFEYLNDRVPIDVSNSHLGYDIRSQGQHESRLIEVKASMEAEPAIRLTEREFDFLFGLDLIKSHGEEFIGDEGLKRKIINEVNARRRAAWIYVVAINDVRPGNGPTQISLYEVPVWSCDVEIFAINTDTDLKSSYAASFDEWEPFSRRWVIIPLRKIIELCSVLGRTTTFL
jgi:hypothetical protein